jgi:NAD(P) transhydrogenase
MNRSLINVLFVGNAPTTNDAAKKMEGSITKTGIDDVVEALLNAENVVITPGYGMAVGQSQLVSASKRN